MAMLRRRAASASRLFSIKTAASAPRDRASRPNAPVPAKASSTAFSANGEPPVAKRPCDRMSNRASRARSLVGRTVSPGGATRRRPRWLPPTMRMLRAAAAQLLRQHLTRHLLHHAARQIAELEWAVGKADQARYLIAEMLEDAAHL